MQYQKTRGDIMNDEKIVLFSIYCKTCKYKDYPESALPCHDCLNNPSNIDSHRPLFYEADKTITTKVWHQSSNILCDDLEQTIDNIKE